jgi:hypothetical protein
MIVACRADRVIGVAFSIAFGATGWLGNVAVDPDARGQRVGTAVSAAAGDALRGAGVSTVVLTATDLGRPIYDRLGFVPDGAPYGIWQRAPGGGAVGGAAADGGVVAGRFEDAVPLDAGATGQDRGAYLARLADRVLAPAGAGLAASLGFRQVRHIPRMRLGPPVPGFRPERIFSTFSFAVG